MRVAKTVVPMLFIGMLVSACVTVLVFYAFPVSITLSGVSAEAAETKDLGGIFSDLFLNFFTNPVQALGNANYLGILAWAIALGILMRKAHDSTKTMLDDFTEGVLGVIKLIISLAPFGILGLVYESVSKLGVQIFTEYGSLLIAMLVCYAFILLVLNPIIAFWGIRKNPYPLVFRTLVDSGVPAFFTRSSAANIPVNLELCRKMGLTKSSYSVCIPLGASISHVAGASTITALTMCAVFSAGMHVELPMALLMACLATLAAAGSSSVAGGCTLLVPMAASLFGLSGDVAMQVVTVGLTLGVITDACETALNSSSVALYTAVAEFRERRLRGIPFDYGKLNERMANAAEVAEDVHQNNLGITSSYDEMQREVDSSEEYSEWREKRDASKTYKAEVATKRLEKSESKSRQ